MAENKLITLREASEISGYNPDYISQLIRSGKLKGQRIGRNWFTTEKAIRGHVKGMRSNGIGALTMALVIFIMVGIAIAFGFWMSSLTGANAVPAVTASTSASNDTVSSDTGDLSNGTSINQ